VKVKVLSSGSHDGNCTLVTDDGLNILFDVGINFKTLQKKLDFALPKFALITHEHGDHANLAAIKKLLERGTQVIMTRGTKNALRLEDRHNLIVVNGDTGGNLRVYNTIHDAAEPAAFSIELGDEKIYYITDTGDIHFPIIGATRLIIEANHSIELLAASDIEVWRKERVSRTHLSIEKLKAALKATCLSKCKEIHLIHISGTNGDGAAFKAMLKPIVGDIPILVEE